jgi:diguanylate cyclase (GGDEF)-like protein
MSTAENHLLERGRHPLLYDAGADEAVGAQRVASEEVLASGERRAVVALGVAFLAVASGLLVAIPEQRNPGLLTIALFVLTFAALSRVEFEAFTGVSVPTQLVFVPMLFVLPLRIVPLAVLLGLFGGGCVDWARGRIVPQRLLLNVPSAWYTIGPVLVLWAFGQPRLTWSAWPVLLLALGAQFAVEIGVIATHEAIAGRALVKSVVPHVVRAQIIDAVLASVGLAVAFAAVESSIGVVLALPLAGLLRVFARERSARIDGALALSDAYRGTAFLLGDVIDGDDAYTGMHSRHVVALAKAVAEELRLPDAEQRDAEFTALLHDVGKIRIPSEIISKPGPLSAEEWALIKLHTVDGEAMLSQVGGLLGSVGRLVRSCHERWDGNGYPDGLAGEDIPRVARIVMCCDAFSAMTTDRAYRSALTREAAVAELRANAGTQFDPVVVEALLTVIGRGVATVGPAGALVEPASHPGDTTLTSLPATSVSPAPGPSTDSAPRGRRQTSRGLTADTAQLLPVAVPVVLAGTVATALAVGALAMREVTLGEVVGALVLLVAAIAAEAYPVPIQGVSVGGVSLAASFLVAAALIYDWQVAVLVSVATRVTIELAQRRPLMKVTYNSAVFALSGLAAGVAAQSADRGRPIVGLIAGVLAAMLAFYAVNVPLVAGIVARATHVRFTSVVRQSVRWTAVPFMIMASLSLMLVVLWQRSPVTAVALAGPLVAVGLYQRSVNGALEAMRLAKTDPLTGLGNHRAFHECLADLSHGRSRIALCLLDADGFKQINDRHGHQAGDDVLVLLAGHIRHDGQAFRLGGDEFAIVLSDVGADEAREITRAVIGRIGGQRQPWGGFVTVSAGIAVSPPDGTATDPDRLFANADAALYQAKRLGRNQVHVFDAHVAILSQARRAAAEEYRLDAAWGLAELIDVADGLADDADPVGSHSFRVSDLAARLAVRCGLQPVEAELVRLAARLHDLGKLAVPVEILRKPGGLEQREWQVLREHPETGRRILSSIGAGAIANWVLHQHERWDGTGYPAGMRGAEIPLEARIIFVAEAYDAITSGRPYQQARSQADALAELDRHAGTQFDPTVVAALTAELADEAVAERLAG